MDIVVTNHALLAIDALEDFIVLPEHDVVVIDEAHDLVGRVTTAASRELTVPAAEAAARRAARILTGESSADREALDRLREAGEGPRPGASRGSRWPPGRAGRAAGDGADWRCAPPRPRVPPRCALSARKSLMMQNDWPRAGLRSPR